MDSYIPLAEKAGEKILEYGILALLVFVLLGMIGGLVWMIFRYLMKSIPTNERLANAIRSLEETVRHQR